MQAYVDSGSNKKKQKLFQNMVHEPLLKGDPDSLVLGLIAIPELHLLIGDYNRSICNLYLRIILNNIGVVDKLMKSIEDTTFPTKEEGLAFMDGFLKQVHSMFVF